MEFSVLFFISFSIIPDVQFDFLSTGVHLANIFRKQFAMTSMSLDNQDYFPYVNNRLHFIWHFSALALSSGSLTKTIVQTKI